MEKRRLRNDIIDVKKKEKSLNKKKRHAYFGGEAEILSPEEQRQLLIRAKKGDITARNKLIESNIPFVIKIAKQYKKSGFDVDELISEGCLGLQRAIEKFDVKKQNNYISYAVWWIRYYMLKSIYDSNSIRKPINKIRQLNYIYKLKSELRSRSLEHKLTPQEEEKYLAKELNVPVAYLNRLMMLQYDVVSLDAKDNSAVESAGDNSSRASIGEMLTDNNVESPETHYLNMEMKHFVQNCIKKLPIREAGIIKMRYGMVNSRVSSLEQVSRKFGLSKERVRQLELRVKKQVKKMYNKG